MTITSAYTKNPTGPGDAFGGAVPDVIATKRAMNEWIDGADAFLRSFASK